jgi:cardiolipin synthase
MLDIASALEDIMRRKTLQSSAPFPACSEVVSQLASSILDEARREPETLPLILQEALNEASRRLDRISLAVTGLAWLGSGIPSVEQEMVTLVKGARREIALCAYSITAGAMTLLREIRDVVSQGVTATLIVNAFNRQPADVQMYLRDAARALPRRWKLLDFAPPGSTAELHAKILAVDRSVALVGSANLSFHGMVSNHEMALVVRGPTAENIAVRVDRLVQGTSVRTVEPQAT